MPHRVTRDDGGLVRSHGPARGRRDPGHRGRRGGRGRRRRGRRVDEDGDVADRAVRRPRARACSSAPTCRSPAQHAAAAARGDRRRGGATPSARARRASSVEARRARDRARPPALARCSATTSPATRSAACSTRATPRPDLAGEHRLLDSTPTCARSRARRHDPERELLHSPQEYLHAFLRSLDAEAERLPERFVDAARSARSRHYGVEGLDRTPALEDACYRLFLSQQRADLARAAVMRRSSSAACERADALVGEVGDGFRGVLDRLETATERRDPVLADLARQLRNRYYRPAGDRRSARGGPTRRWSDHLRRARRGRGDRDEHIDAVVECAAAAGAAADRPHDRATPRAPALLEVMTRRYYRDARARAGSSSGWSTACRSCITELRGRRARATIVAAAFVDPRRPRRRAARDRRARRDVPEGERRARRPLRCRDGDAEALTRPEGARSSARAAGRGRARRARRARAGARRHGADAITLRRTSTAAGRSTATCRACTRRWPSG